MYLAALKDRLMIRNRFIILLAAVAVFWSCNNDDDNNVTIEPPRPLDEVLGEDEDEIQEYLNTHYYNYAEFENPPADFDYKIVLKEIPEGDTTGIIPLKDQVSSKTVQVDGIAEDEASLSHTYYYLEAREGVGGMPTVADSVFIKYQGSLLDGTEFDSTSNFSWQYLPNFLRGYALGATEFKVGGEIVVAEDGTFEIKDTGVGMVIMPSALGYYNSAVGSIPSYSPLIFRLELGSYVEDTDYDGDGIPSLLEDLNGDGNLNNDNTDGDITSTGSCICNHADSDDDNDGIPTRDEIEIDSDGNITYPDSDGDGTPDYLDSDS